VKRLADEGLEALQLDLDDSSSIQAAVDTIMERTGGRLYGLFNNGAYGQPGAVEDLTRDVLRAQFETNLFGWLELTNQLIPVMRKQGEGRIIQNSSVLGLVALPFRGAYNSSKYAIEGLSDTLRMELKGSGVYISLIEPGPIISRFRANAHAKLKENIDRENSVFAEKYRGAEKRLTREGPAAPFTLPPEAVVKKLVHALEAPRPRARYYVTFPTYLFGILKRFLSSHQMDWILGKVSSEENR
jgi:NAD(P)-dependent dehydrogenase (short-subunit alcohol dehydrogenase family)